MTDTARKRSTRRRLVIAGAFVLLLLLAILLPPYLNISRYQRSIAGTISRSLGRPVHLSGVQLRLLPMPGIVINNFEVEEEPAFGAEPALRASSVVATLRLSSLWRGRLEVSRISLDDASLNLVRDAQGRWNIGSILGQASRISNAPTAQRRAGSSPRFPYIEATDARINFKEGLEKKPFSLMNAEFAMWLDTPSQWRVRLKAQPVRTDLDLDLSDTGELTVNGSLRRDSDLNAMPVNLDAEWSGAQLGQVSRLLMGSDTGWRGDLDVTANLTGDISDLHVRSRVRIGNAHRQEFEPMVSQDVDARCEGDYLRTTRDIQNLTCFWPVGDGHLLLTGNLQGAEKPGTALKLEINHAPASLAVNLIGLLRQHAGNASVTGTINGDLEYARTPVESLTGQAVVDGATLQFAGLANPLRLPPLRFVAASSHPAPPPGVRSIAAVRLRHAQPPLPLAIQLQNVPVAMGAETPLGVSGEFTRSGFTLHFTGQAALDRLLPLSRDFGFMQSSLAPISSAQRQGSAASQSSVNLDLSVQAPWLVPVADQDHPELAATTLGSAQIRNVRLQTAFLPEPLEIASATVTLQPGAVSWNNASAVFHGIPIHGSISYQPGCPASVSASATGSAPAPCPVQFALDTSTLDAGALQLALLGAGNRGELLDAILARIGGQHHTWPVLNGSIRIASLQLGVLPLHNVLASVSIADTSLRIASLDASTLGGTVHAFGSLDAGAPKPAWKLNVQLSRVPAADVSALFHERWGAAGTMNADAEFTAQGFTRDALASSATGNFHFDWQNGALPVTVSGLPLPHFERCAADGTIASGRLNLVHGRILRPGQSASLSGTVSFARDIDLQAAAPGGSYRLTGTLAHPAAESASPVAPPQNP
jgi:hypothetical protein